ncbi:hypothetical protein [Marinobacter sp. ST-43]|uniref:hypothetical protein n=1 Tax=Marinobacter sp. ST-43 TaxID=3050453 RepID=UPI0026E015E8|nr:hypothetical protein [Marinobacter sp. ST-43]
MKKILALAAAVTLVGCATQTPQMKDVEPTVSAEQQRAAQLEAQQANAPGKLALKRKIAVCVFQTKVATDSRRSLPPIPRESCH